MRVFNFVVVSVNGPLVAASAHLIEAESFVAAHDLAKAKQSENFPEKDGWKQVSLAGHQVNLGERPVNSASRLVEG